MNLEPSIPEIGIASGTSSLVKAVIYKNKIKLNKIELDGLNRHILIREK